MSLVPTLFITAILVILGIRIIKSKEASGGCGGLLGKSCYGGQTCVNGVCQCPSGQSLVGGTCVSPPPSQSCGSGQVWNNVLKVCQPGGATTTPVSSGGNGNGNGNGDGDGDFSDRCTDDCKETEKAYGTNFTCKPIDEEEDESCTCECQRKSCYPNCASNRVYAYRVGRDEILVPHGTLISKHGIIQPDTRMLVSDLNEWDTPYNLDGNSLPFLRDSIRIREETPIKFSNI